MNAARIIRRARSVALLISALVAPPLGAQSWRRGAEGVGNSARVLIVGTRPEDEDNALIAWLSLGRHVETAYLSLTRGEAGMNVAGNERQSALGVVRTAELLAERARDGAHQYFTRAYDVGPARSDSVVDAMWPGDALLMDVVAVIRAFRPQIVISLFADSTDADPTHRVAARLTRDAFQAATDTLRFPAAAANGLPAWTPSRLLTRVDSAWAGASGVTIDVGEFDRDSGRSYAELGAETRRLQRTQRPVAAPPLGPVRRYLRVDRRLVEGGGGDLFAGVDTTLARFRAMASTEAQPFVDSLAAAVLDVHALSAHGGADSLAVALAHVARHALDVRTAFACGEEAGVARCAGALGDLATTVTSIRERATRALLGAAGLVVDGTVTRELVAAGDSVAVAASVFNGGSHAVIVRRLQANSGSGWVQLVHDSVLVPADSVRRWVGNLRVNATNLHWWQTHGLVRGTALHDFRGRTVVGELISGEDRIPASQIEATISIAGIDVPIIAGPLVAREGLVRGDARHALAGTTPISVLFERTAEYERANLQMDRLVRVFVSSARTILDTVVVTLKPAAGLTVDTARRTIVVPPLGGRSVFFRVRGMMRPGEDSSVASAQIAPRDADSATHIVSSRVARYTYGMFPREYPHIPTQQFIRGASVRLEAVDIRLPARLGVAYVRGSDDVQTPLGQLQINVHAIEPSLLSVVDLTAFSTVLIGAGARANDALTPAIPSLREFMRQGGTVVVLPNGEDIGRSGLLPYPIGFDSIPRRVSDPNADIRTTNGTSSLLRWPNVITAQDFADWTGERARDVPSAVDARYRTVLSTGDPGQPATSAALLVAPVGKGMIIYSSLSLDLQLAAVHPGAARLFVNLLSAGLVPK